MGKKKQTKKNRTKQKNNHDNKDTSPRVLTHTVSAIIITIIVTTATNINKPESFKLRIHLNRVNIKMSLQKAVRGKAS